MPKQPRSMPFLTDFLKTNWTLKSAAAARNGRETAPDPLFSVQNTGSPRPNGLLPIRRPRQQNGAAEPL